MGIYKKIIAGIIEFPAHFSLRAKDLVRCLLNPHKEERLGVAERGQDIMRHAFFEGVAFDDMWAMRVPSPWVPEPRGAGDPGYFERVAEGDEAVERLRDDMQQLFVDF